MRDCARLAVRLSASENRPKRPASGSEDARPMTGAEISQSSYAPEVTGSLTRYFESPMHEQMIIVLMRQKSTKNIYLKFFLNNYLQSIRG